MWSPRQHFYSKKSGKSLKLLPPCQILRHQLGLCPRSLGGVAPTDLLAGFERPTSKGREKDGRGGEGEALWSPNKYLK